MALLTAGGLSSCGSSSHGSHLLYVTTGQGIYAYRIDNKSRNSTAIFSAPFSVGNTSGSIVISPSGQFAYVANEDDNTISLYKIDRVSGSLSEVLPRTPSGGFSPNSMVLDTSGSTLFVGNQLSNDVTGIWRSVVACLGSGSGRIAAFQPCFREWTVVRRCAELLASLRFQREFWRTDCRQRLSLNCQQWCGFRHGRPFGKVPLQSEPR